MSDEAAEQTKQMVNFILNEANEKAEDIMKKGLEEFNIDKHKYLTHSKEHIRQEYSRKLKAAETQNAIKRSVAVNKSRLDKIERRQAMISVIQENARKELVNLLKDETRHRNLLTMLICQGLLAFLESDVTVRCRECDKGLVASVLSEAAEKYSDIIMNQTGVRKSVQLKLDAKSYLNPPPSEEGGPSCLGGVVLHCQSGLIKIDNTIDARLELVLEQDKPAIRNLLFPPLLGISTIEG